MQNFKTLASLCSWAGRFESYLVANPEKRFSHDEAHLASWLIYELRHDKTNNMAVCPAKAQISLGVRPVWSESLLSAWSDLGSLATHWAHSEDSDQTGRMPRLIWVFAGRTVILLVFSWRGSYYAVKEQSDQGLHCLPFCLHFLDPLLHSKVTLF